jgi:hypothetical protein
MRLRFRWKRWILEARRKARALDQHLFHAVDLRRRFDPGQIQKRRRQIAGMGELVTEVPATADALRPADDQRIANAAAVGILFVAAKGRIGRHGPTQREIRVCPGSADFIDTREFLGERFVSEVARAVGVYKTERATLLAGAIVGDDDGERIVERPCLLKEIDEAGQVLIT